MKIGYLMQTGAPNLHAQPLAGPAIHVKRVIEELNKRGHPVRLLMAFDRRIWRSDDLVNFVPITVPAIDRGLLRWVERGVRRAQYELRLPYAALFESWRFALACQQELHDCDLFYERLGWVGYGGGLAAQRLKIPWILEVNGDHPAELEMQGMAPRGMQRRLSMALMKKSAHWAAHTVASGEGWRKRYIERWAVDPRRVTTVENGSELVALLARHQLRAFQRAEQPNAVTTIAYAGGFDPWQGVTILIRVVARIVADKIPVCLLLIGAGRESDAAKQLVQNLHLDAHVKFTGQLNAARYAEMLAQAEIGVSPYCGRVEFSGLKLLDYKAAGLATIASGQSGEPAVIQNGKTGVIVPPCDEDALYHAIIDLCANADRRKQMGQTARIQAEQMHGWDKTAECLDQLFARVIQEYHDHKI